MSHTVLHVLPDLEVGGGQLVLLWTLEAMVDSDTGSRHLVLAAGGGQMESEFRRVASKVVVADGVLGGIRAGRRMLAEEHVDLIHCNNTSSDRLIGQLMSLRAGPPLVNTLHGVAPERSRWNVKRHLNRFLGRKIAWTIGVSADAAKSYADVLSLNPNNISIVPGCLAPDRFDVPEQGELAAVRAELGAGPDEILVMSIGRLVSGKNTDILPSVIAALVRRGIRARLAIVGDGPQGDIIERAALVAGVEDWVDLIGQRADITSLLSAADVFVSASTSEGFGLTLVEAMATGTPVVAFDLPAFQDFTDHGRAAWLVPPPALSPEDDDVERLASAIERVCSELQIVKERTDLARQLARGFSARRRADAHNEIYRSLLADRSVPVEP